ncbi:uncharacterized protein LOC113272534 [Papaver somniferum]|uniref:uncharacterized protein LOC113272534 n=1 Tax=Papaver somniferum TaxID=3469 RepID=UPI000E6F8A76|nr:uncharacterized protein LOC113272534 [Papaver somniferum]
MDSVPKAPGKEVRHHDNLGFNNESNSQKVPSIELPDDLFEEGLNPWKFSLIGILDLQHIKFVNDAIILRQQWKLVGDCKLIPLGRIFFTIKLDNETDRRFIKSGQWEVLNQVLQVRNWISNFIPSKKITSKAQVWVRFPGLGLEFWKEKILFTICKEIGTPIKIDTATAKCEVGYYANMLVENKRASERRAPPKLKASAEIPHTPFDICDRSMVESSPSKVQPSTSNSVIQPNSTEDSVVLNIATPVTHSSSSGPTNSVVGGRFSALNNSNDKENDIVEDPTVQVELSPKKLLQIAEVTELENSVVKFIDADSGKVTTDSVPLHLGLQWLRHPQGMIAMDVGYVLVFGVHAHVNVVQRRYLWSEMQLISELKKPRAILGDFNVVLSIEEKVGGRSPSRISMTDFNDCINSCELLQAPKIGLDFSWSNCQQGSQRILCNLDRVVFNM